MGQESDRNSVGDSRNREFIAQIKYNGAITSPEVERAFLDTPRHLFLPHLSLDSVYVDDAVATHKRERSDEWLSSSSQPSLMAHMLELLDVHPGMRVLEIGAGTGYNAALLASLTGDPGLVHSIDISEECVAEARTNVASAGKSGIDIVCGDGLLGLPHETPFDRIIATASTYDIPLTWYDQLNDGGRLVVPWGAPPWYQRLLVFDKHGAQLVLIDSCWCKFIQMRGPGETSRAVPPGASMQSKIAKVHVLHGVPSTPVTSWDCFTAFASIFLWPDLVVPGTGRSESVGLGSMGGNSFVPRMILTYSPPWAISGTASAEDIERVTRVVVHWYDLGQPPAHSLRMIAVPMTAEIPSHIAGDWIERTWFRYLVSWGTRSGRKGNSIEYRD